MNKQNIDKTLSESITNIIYKALTEASIFDMETANGRMNTKSKTALAREKNIIYKLKELGIKATFISSGSRQTSLNGANDENKLVQGTVYSEYQTIKINNPIKNELDAGEYYIYVKSAQGQYENCILSEKPDKFGKNLWENDNVKYVACIITSDRDYYEYFIIDKKILFAEFNKLVAKFKASKKNVRQVSKSTGNTVMYAKANGYTCTFCYDFLEKHAALQFHMRRYY